MGLREAAAFLKGAVAKTTSANQVAKYTFNGGWVHAQSLAILAAYPVANILGSFGLAAAELDAALGRMSTEPKIEPADGRLALRCGRLKSSIDLFAAEPPAHAPMDELSWAAPPEGLISAVAAVLPFVASEGTWQRSVELRPGFVRAVSGQCACLHEVDGLEVDGPTALTDDSAEWLTSLPVKPESWAREGDNLWFRWPSGAWARLSLMAREWPAAVIDRIFEGSKADCPVPVTDVWREALADCKALGDGTVDVSSDRMVARSAHGIHEEEFDTGVVSTTRWPLKTLANVLAVAEAWDPDSASRKSPAAFRGPRLRGVAMGLSR